MDRISEVTQIPVAHLVAPGRRHPYDVVGQIWRELRVRFPDRALPLERAKTTPAPFLYDLWRGAHFAPNLREALEHVAQFRRLASDDLTLEILDDPPAFSSWHPADVVDEGAAAMVFIAVSYRILDELFELGHALSSVEIGWPPFGPPDAFPEFFGVPVRFHASRTALCFRSGALSTTLRTANDVMFEEARRQLGARLANLPAGDRLAIVRRAIADNASKGDFTADALAARLHVSLRALQRLVADHGTTPRALIDHRRTENARRLLDDSRLSVSEVADRVGYSGDRAFRRAFKRDTGHTPAAYRRTRDRTDEP